MRAGEKSGSTPTWSCCAPTWNQTPPRLSERLRLLDLLEPEQLAEEAAGGVLAAGRGGELDVVDAVDHGLRLARRVTPRVTPDGEW